LTALNQPYKRFCALAKPQPKFWFFYRFYRAIPGGMAVVRYGDADGDEPWFWFGENESEKALKATWHAKGSAKLFWRKAVLLAVSIRE
jgi:hypothetical protein